MYLSYSTNRAARTFTDQISRKGFGVCRDLNRLADTPIAHPKGTQGLFLAPSALLGCWATKSEDVKAGADLSEVIDEGESRTLMNSLILGE